MPCTCIALAPLDYTVLPAHTATRFESDTISNLTHAYGRRIHACMRDNNVTELELRLAFKRNKAAPIRVHVTGTPALAACVTAGSWDYFGVYDRDNTIRIRIREHGAPPPAPQHRR